MKLGQAYQKTVQALKAAGIDSPELESRRIIQERTGHDWAAIITNPETEIDFPPVESDLARRLAGEPLSRIYGEREFYGLTFKIGPETLDPRPDTELLVERVLQRFHVKQNSAETLEILDLGVGSGCIILTLLHHIKNARGVGVDLSNSALQIYLHNAKLLGVNPADSKHSAGMQRAHGVCGHWAQAINGQFDIIVSNPPYIAEPAIPGLDVTVRNHDPILALAGGKDGLQAYREIFSDLPRLLKPAGRAYFEIGFDQGDSVMRLAGESRIRAECIHRDLGGRQRVVEMTRGDK